MNFRTGKQVPKQHSSDDAVTAKKSRQGRREETERHEAFLKVANYLEQNADE